MDITARDRIIAKVKKCLALAKSGNEHEAAAALRQAQKLMAAHGISDLDIEHADIQEEVARAGAAFKPARWESELAVRVARAFDCKLIFRTGLVSGIGRWVFVGATPSGEIARYAFEVLLRQARKARARITAYLEQKHSTLVTLKSRDRNAGHQLSARAYGDFASGHRAGRDAQLNRGLGGAGECAALPV